MKELEVEHVPQTESNWCWASSTAMIINYYDYNDFSDCDIASQYFNNSCCDRRGMCNKQSSIYDFWKILEPHEIYTRNVEGRISINDIIYEIDHYNPLIIRIESIYGGHFMVIRGYLVKENISTGKRFVWLQISDPMYGYIDPSTRNYGWYVLPWDDIVKGKFPDYNARWTHTLRFYD